MPEITVIQAIILGVVEGITEYLPISSTGHLILMSSLLGLDAPPERKAAVDAFTIIIQGGAILAVLGLYAHHVLRMLRGIVGKDAAGRKLAINLIVAFLPAAVLGVLLADLIERRLFHPPAVLAALAIGGIVMIAIGPWQRRHFAKADAHAHAAPPPPDAEPLPHLGAHEDDPPSAHAPHDVHPHLLEIDDLSWKQSLIIGLLQCIAMWPGTSRSMVTIVGGMLVGLRPRASAEFSFLLGLPTLGGACVYKLLDGFREGDNVVQTLGIVPMLIGIAVASVSAALAIRWLVGFLTRHGVSIFGWYRLALALVFGVLWWQGYVSLSP